MIGATDSRYQTGEGVRPGEADLDALFGPFESCAWSEPYREVHISCPGLSLNVDEQGVLSAVYLQADLAPVKASPQALQAIRRKWEEKHKVDPALLIVPGKSIGTLALGMTLEELQTHCPSCALKKDATRSFAVIVGDGNRPDRANEVWLDSTGVVSKIWAGAYNTALRTAKGVGIGTRLAQFIAAYGTGCTATLLSFEGRPRQDLDLSCPFGLELTFGAGDQELYTLHVIEPFEAELDKLEAGQALMRQWRAAK